MQDSSYIDIVMEAWSFLVYGCEMYKLCRRLKVLKAKLKAMNLSKFSNLANRVKEAREQLRVAQSFLELDPHNGNLQDAEGVALGNYRTLQSL